MNTVMGFTCPTSRLKEVGEEESFEGKMRKTEFILLGKKIMLAMGINTKGSNYLRLNS